MKRSKNSHAKSNRSKFRVGLLKHHKDVDYKLTSQVRRSWITMSLMAGIMIGFGTPAFAILIRTISDWQQVDDLRQLVGALFNSFWLIGWSITVIGPLFALIWLVFGRHVILIHSGRIDIIWGIPGMSFYTSRATSKVKSVSLVNHSAQSLFPKNGSQLLIETNKSDKITPFGSNMSMVDVAQIQSAINKNKMMTSDLEIKSFTKNQAHTDAVTSNQQQIYSTSSNDEILNKPITLTSSSTLFLIVANLVPLIGAFIFDWDLASTMVLYWAETAIILFFTIAKIIAKNKIPGLIISVFVITHAAAFMAMHFLFIWMFFVEHAASSASFRDYRMSTVITYLSALWPALLALVLSHGYSFKRNFLDKRFLRNKDTEAKHENFYSRILVMHITIIFGGGLALMLGSNIVTLGLLIVMKITIDVKAHLKQHSKLNG